MLTPMPYSLSARSRIYHNTLRLFISLLLILLSILIPAIAQVSAINAAKIDGRETISVFFEEPQLFKDSELQNQFKVTLFDDTTYEYVADTQGKWHLSKDGYRLSYYPVKQGSYEVKSEDFTHNRDTSRKSADIYIGQVSEAVKIIGRGPVLPLADASIPVEMIGTTAVDIEYYAIENLPQLLKDYYIGNELDNWTVSRLIKNTQPAGIFRYMVPSGTKVEEKSLHRIPLDKNIKPGAYLVTVNPAGEIYKTLDTRIVFISNIGLQARLYPEESLIIANQFTDNAPISGASLEVWRDKNGKLEQSKTLCTFKEGLCQLPERLKTSDIIVVKAGEDVSILPLKEIALDLNEFTVTGAPSTKDVAYIYSNRTLYRPGERMTINTLLRDFDGNTLTPQPLTLTLINPQGKAYNNFRVDKSTEGFYQTDIKMPQDAKTGVWQLEARTDATSERPLGTLKLYIEEFMPERMELILTGEERPYAYNEGFDLTIASRYLFGAPAAMNQYNVQSDISINRTPFIGHQDWYAGIESFPYQQMISQYTAEGTLDESGNDTIILSLPSAGAEDSSRASAVMKMDMTVNILDGSVLGITRELKRDFWPDRSIPVIRPLFKENEIGYGKAAKFELFTADNTGEIAPSNFLLTLKYQDPSCTWIYSNARGWDCHYSYDYQIREQKRVESPGVIDYEFSPNSWGSYLLEIKDLDSGLVSEFSFSGSWESSNSGQLPAVKPQHLNLSTQKPSFMPGETVDITINAPLAGNLTLLIEGSEVLYQNNVDIKQGETKISVPMSERWNRHDLYLSGVLISHNDQGETVRSLGIVPLKIDSSTRKLTPSLSFPAVALPDNPITISVELSQEEMDALNIQKDEPLYATISITDQGILNMIPEKPISIVDAFFKQRQYSAEIIDYYSRLFKRGAGSLLNPQFGGDGVFAEEDETAIPNLTEMKTVSLTSDLISLENGKANITFDLPDFNGEAEVMVKLFNKTQVGETQKPLTIRAPIVADLVTPRFIRVGDQSYISLSLVNMSGKEDSAKISISSDQFDISFEETITLPVEEKVFKLIPISLKSFMPFAEVSLDIAADSFKATRTYQIGTVHKTEETTLYERELLKANTLWQRNLAISGHYDIGFEEHITLSRNPQINVLAYTNGLFEYPYGCSEQITSKAFPWLFKANPILDQEKEGAYQRSLNQDPANKAENFTAWEHNMMRDTISRLLDRQRLDGGFSLWSEGPSFLATSVYVTDFLSNAQNNYPELVPQAALDQAYHYLKQALGKSQAAYNRYGLNIDQDYEGLLTRSHLANISYATWLLAKAGKVFSADLLFLPNLTDRLTPLSSAYLGAAMMVLGDENAGKIYLAPIVEKVKAADQAYGYYQSSVSELALTLNVLNELTERGFTVSAELKTELMFYLTLALQERQYFSTQDRYALIKLGIELPEDPTPIAVIINGKAQEVAANSPIKASSIGSFEAQESLFIEYQIAGYPKVPVESLSFDMAYQNTLAALSGQSFKVGDRFEVRIEVTPSVSLPSALLVSYIPGGFNLVNPNLETDNLYEFYENLGISYDQRSRIEHEEFRFDRYVVSLPMQAQEKQTFTYILEAAVPGEYEIPVTILEDMYLPSLHNIMVTPGSVIIEDPSELR